MQVITDKLENMFIRLGRTFLNLMVNIGYTNAISRKISIADVVAQLLFLNKKASSLI
jgi:N-acetylmuramic acid 6-phosphate (MurNAc-6-P) etherase